MSTAEDRMLEHTDRVMEAITGKRPQSTDDRRSQDRVRADFIASLDDDACSDMVCEIARENWSEIAEAVQKCDAFALSHLFDRCFDRRTK